MDKKAKLTFLGTGTSQGVPVIGCKCKVCLSLAPEDKRLRSSALVDYCGLRILIDAGPDFRFQMLRAGVSHIDALLLTHKHRDHTGGMDDLRSLNYIDSMATEVFCEKPVLEALQSEYPYAFEKNKYIGAPEWNINLIDERPFFIFPSKEKHSLVWVHDVGYCYKSEDGTIHPRSGGDDIISEAVHSDPSGKGVEIIPIRGLHDKMPVLGFRFGNIAYITDMSYLPDTELAKLKGLDHVTLNTVGYKKHHSHFSLDEALELSGRIGAKHTWLTHLSHAFPVYSEFCKELADKCKSMGLKYPVLPAYDGLTIF